MFFNNEDVLKAKSTVYRLFSLAVQRLVLDFFAAFEKRQAQEENIGIDYKNNKGAQRAEVSAESNCTCSSMNQHYYC